MNHYHIDFKISLLYIVMNWSERIFMTILLVLAREDYSRYFLQICLILLSHIIIEGKQSGNLFLTVFYVDERTINSLLNMCHCIHPGLGLYRFYLGGMKVLQKSYLDAVYYYMSSIDCMLPYDCREQLETLFEQCSKVQYQLESDKRKGMTIEAFSLRVYILRFIRAVRSIWTNIDLDGLPEYSKCLGSSLSNLISQWGDSDVRLSSKTLIRLVTIVLMTIENAMKETDMYGRFQKAHDNKEIGKTKMVFISEVDRSMNSLHE